VGPRLSIPEGEQYVRDELAIYPVLSYQLTESTWLGLAGNFRWNTSPTVGPQLSRILQDQPNDGWRAGMGLLFDYDSRDNVNQPSEGFFSRSTLTGFPGVVQRSMWQFRSDNRHFYSIGDDHVIAQRFFFSYSDREMFASSI
jgi:outer membrane protein assembly factor BamA